VKSSASIDILDSCINSTSGQKRLHYLRVAVLGREMYSSIASRRESVDGVLILLDQIDDLLYHIEGNRPV
jgi:hypothetical protein